ncbi:MATE family efflux transporter [Brenneria rubrifaciens]|uniref:Multidrug export protein MepA n=1 Tax=Brenneria rubrifaciens TaxID=55213 RepID=A0A4V1F9X3_9GAMM|nr:MATE family efflux transporter [Brenneria rubrifaciens]QCR09073.1 MATE family efflux transporter [Brenneria rubrifaciens]
MKTPVKNSQNLDGLANDDIFPLILKLAIPTIIGVSVSALYQLLNAFFIGRLGTHAIAAMALTFPFAIAISTIGICFGAGGASFVSRSLGSGKIKEAGRYALSSFLGGLITALLLSFLIRSASLKIFVFMGAENETLILSQRYLRWLLMGYILVVINMISGFIVRAEGNTRMSMKTQLMAFGCNAILDPIFIFYFNFGIEGAGIATLLGQCASVAMYIIHFSTGKSAINLTQGLAAKKDVFAILGIGFPTALNALLQVVSISFLNRVALQYGDAVVAGIGISSRLLMVAALPLNGLCMGAQVLVGYNIGADKFQRVRDVIKTLSLLACGSALLYSLICLAFSEQMASFFSDDKQVIDVASLSIQIFHLAMPFIALQQIFLMYFQSIGVAKIALYVSLLRYLVLTLPLLWILPWYWNVSGIYWAFPLADIVTGLIGFAILRAQMSSLKRTDSARLW